MAAVALSALTQRPAIGSAAPDALLRDLQGAERALLEFAGPKGVVVVFWAAWSDRSIEELRRLESLKDDLARLGVRAVAVNVDQQAMTAAAIQGAGDRYLALGITLPCLVDDGLKLFRAYGVVTVPSTVLVDANRRVAYFSAGYSIAGREDLFHAIDKLAGIERAAAAAEPAIAPAALRRFRLGLSELATRRVAAARKSFEAAAADEAYIDPIVQLAALAIEDGDLVAADALLTRALAADPQHAGARRERARAIYAAGRGEDARRALEELTTSVPTDPVTHAYFGFVLEAAGRALDADAAFERAIAAGGQPPRDFTTRETTTEAVLAMMTAYRRASALRSP